MIHPDQVSEIKPYRFAKLISFLASVLIWTLIFLFVGMVVRHCGEAAEELTRTAER